MEILDLIYESYTAKAVIVIIGVIIAYIILNKKKSEVVSNTLSRLSPRKSNTPMLDSFTVDFTELAKIERIDPVIGRHREVLRLAQVLSRKSKNNAILVGAPGVGKTAIVEGLAQRIVSGEVPETLKDKRLLSLNVSTLLAGTKYRGEFEQRAKKLVKEIEASNRSIILFIDEIHSVIQTQGTEGSVNFSDIIKPALSRGDMQMIGATTMEEYDKYIRKDAALERRFQPVKVDEPNEKESIEILQGVKDKYRDYHKVEFTDAALEAAVKFTNEKIKHRQLPDKAIDAIDEAASMVRVAHVHEAIPIILYQAAVKKYPELGNIWKQIQAIDKKSFKANKKEKKVLDHQREQLEERLEKRGVLVVDASDIEEIVNEWVHGPQI